MDRSSASPLFIAVYFLLRCLIPLLIMLGVSYLLRRLGLIKEAQTPPDQRNGSGNDSPPEGNGGLAHGSV